MADINAALMALGNEGARGGANTTAVAAAATAAAIKATPGRLCTVMVTTLGTAALQFFDNATTGSGTIIGQLIASAPVGTIAQFNMPAANGIWCASTTNTPAVTVSWD